MVTYCVAIHSYSTYFSIYNQVEGDEMGGSCSTYGGEEESVQVIDGKVRGKETSRKT
jgi:hypothetical protein